MNKSTKLLCSRCSRAFILEDKSNFVFYKDIKAYPMYNISVYECTSCGLIELGKIDNKKLVKFNRRNTNV
uniref:Uncharacterized protein n=1 Tax=viral metagenome TaxID=1070528 RepID=A0A6H1ZAA3_9ZZZZ